MPSSSLEKVVMKAAGFRIDKVVEGMMKDLRITYPVKVFFDQPDEMAMAERPFGVAEVHLPTRAMIKRKMPDLSEEEITAKQISEVAEELTHLQKMETCHDNPRFPVVPTTIRLMKKHMTKRQWNSRYIQGEKLTALKAGKRFDEDCVEWRK